MKIAQVVCVFPPYKGGIGRVAFEYSKILADAGHKVTVFTPEYNNSNENLNLNFKIIKIKPLIKYGNAGFIPGLLKYLDEYEIVHLHYPFFGGTEIIWLAKFFFHSKFRLILHYHMDVKNLSWLPKILSYPSKFIFNSIIKQSNAVTCASLDYIKNSQIKKLYESFKEKFYEIPFFIDTGEFRPEIETPAKERQLLFVGGLDKAHYFKGLEVLLKSLTLLENSSVNLKIIGDGNMRSRYEKIANDLNIEKRVNFVGELTDRELKNNYKQSLALVLPSVNSHEAFGLVILEALASGIPVIASNLPGVRRVFKDGQEGLLFTPGDAVDLKNKIEIISGDNNLNKNMALAARKLAIEKYDKQVVVAQILNLFNKIYSQKV